MITPRRTRRVKPSTGARLPLYRFRTITILWLIGSAGLLVVGGMGLLIYSQLTGGEDRQPGVITATPAAGVPPAPDGESGENRENSENSRLGLGIVTYDFSGQYAFPIAAEPHLFTWTHHHWDGINAADLEIRFGVSYPEFVQLTNAPLVAVTSGTALDYSGNIGGLGYMLQGDDGVDYYYAHLSAQRVPDGARVTAGQPLGAIGNTGGSAQFIEPHLHLAIGPRDSLWTVQPGINTAEWIKDRFGLGWEERPAAIIEPDRAQGWPVTHPAIAIVTPFEQSTAQGLPQPAVELGFTQTPPDERLDVIATLSGEVNVIRWTAHYGTRIQINNDPAQTTVVISGVDEWLVKDGDTISRGQVIGRWNPAHRPRMHYMIYQDSVIVDPTTTLG
jgi:hypothetical protein